MVTIQLDDVITSKYKVSEKGFKEKERAKKGSGTSIKIEMAYDFDGATADDVKELLLKAMDVMTQEDVRNGKHGTFSKALDGASLETNVHELANRERATRTTVAAKVEKEVAADRKRTIEAFRARMEAKGMDNAETEAVIAEVFSV